MSFDAHPAGAHPPRASGFRKPGWLAWGVCLVAIACAPAGAQPTDGGEVQLRCGTTVTAELASGEVDTYRPFIVVAGAAAIIDVTDVSGTTGVLRLFSEGGLDTCAGSAQLTAEPAAARSLQVSDCIDDDSGAYAIAMNVVTAGDDNCGAALRCGEVRGAQLDAGDVDSYALTAVAATPLRVTADDPTDSSRQLRLRLYGPDAALLGDSCGGALDIAAPVTGTHTILISACDGTSPGPYRVAWQRSPSCGAAGPADEVAYVFNAGSGTVAGVRTTNGRVESLLPAFPGSGGAGVVVPSVDGAFVYVGSDASPVIKVVNTGTNRIVASGPAVTAGAHFALHPDGRSLYVPSAIAQGIVVIDTATMSIRAMIRVDQISNDDAVATSPDGQRLFVLQSDAARIVMIEGNAVVGEIAEIGTGQRQILVSPSGERAFVFGGAQISVIDLVERVVLGQVAVETGDLELSLDGARAYAVRGPEKDVAVVDVVTRAVIDSIPLPDFRQPAGIGISAASGLLYVTDGVAAADASLAIIDPASKTVTALLGTFGEHPMDLVLVRVPDGLCIGDEIRESKVTVGELVTSVNYAIDGCPGEQLQETLAMPAGGDSERKP